MNCMMYFVIVTYSIMSEESVKEFFYNYLKEFVTYLIIINNTLSIVKEMLLVAYISCDFFYVYTFY